MGSQYIVPHPALVLRESFFDPASDAPDREAAMATAVTFAWEKAQEGLRAILEFGALLCRVEEWLKARGGVRRGPGAVSLAAWLRDHCPQVNYKTAMGYRAAALGLREAAKLAADRPLLHFSRRIAAAQGYEIRIMDYKGFPSKVKGDRKRMEESFDIALGQAREMLSGVDLEEYEDILFIGKSIGNIVAAKIASESPAKERIRMILYTPLDDTFTFSFGKEAIAFTGDDDPWVGREKSRISALCEARGIPCTVIPQANHSLESGDVFSDLKELYRIMETTERFIVRPGEE